MAPQAVTIIGAGISGLTLGRALRAKGIPAVLYERAKANPTYSYSITLHDWAFQPLLRLLNLDAPALRDRAGLAASRNGASTPTAKSFRVHRSTFQELLKEGLDIRYGKNLVDLQHTEDGVKVEFEDGEAVTASSVVAADGALSTVRKLMLPHFQPQVHPYVVFNAKCWLEGEDCPRVRQYFVKDTCDADLWQKDVLLQTYINEDHGEKLSISFTYSRPAHERHDPLHKPERTPAGASDIPEEFFDELSQLRIDDEPFKTIFEVKRVRHSRMLHWLMRSALIPEKDATDMAKAGVAMLGDAVHGMPILGSVGANVAIMDALELADKIAEGQSIEQFSMTKWHRWHEDVAESINRLVAMHGTDRSATAVL